VINLNLRRYSDEAAVAMGAMIMFIAAGVLACLILATMIQMVEVTAQTPESIMNLATRESADKIIIHEIYIWDEWDNYGVIWELAPGSEPKTQDELFWILQCTDNVGEYWAFWGDFTGNSMDIRPHEFVEKQKSTPGLKAEFFDNAGMNSPGLPDLTNRIPDIITIENQINYPKGGGAWTTTSLGNLPWADEFSLRASGYLDVTIDGTYTFEVNADDGYALWVDGQLIVDGVNSASSGNIELNVGKVPIQIEYNENAGVAGLELWWESPDIPKQIIPAGSLFHDDNMIDSNGNDNWITVTTFQPGILYEISIDQKNGNAGANNVGTPPVAETCGPTQLHEHGLDGDLTFVVSGGGTTWTHFHVPDDTAGSRLV